MSDFKCNSDDCGGWVCIYHGLRHEVKEHIDQLEADSKHLDAILQFFRDDGFDEDIVYSISKYCEKHGLPIND